MLHKIHPKKICLYYIIYAKNILSISVSEKSLKRKNLRHKDGEKNHNFIFSICIQNISSRFLHVS